MRINFTLKFKFLLENQVRFIAKDKPIAAKKFKNDLITNLKNDLKFPFHFKKSIYSDDENARDYVFKGYTIVYYIDTVKKIVSVFAFIKHKDSL